MVAIWKHRYVNKYLFVYATIKLIVYIQFIIVFLLGKIMPGDDDVSFEMYPCQSNLDDSDLLTPRTIPEDPAQTTYFL